MSDPYPEPPCPFCAIASNHPPSPPSQCSPEPADKESTAGKAFIILSTKYLLAFLDIMPLSRGHVLVVTRKHYRTLDKVGVELGMELGKWLPVVSRVVNKTVTGDVGDGADTQPHWNVVQNNGARAAQVVPHVHFHVVPRPPLKVPGPAARPNFAMFGRGQREDLDDEEGEELARAMRVEMEREVKRIREEEGIDLDVDMDYSAYQRRQGNL